MPHATILTKQCLYTLGQLQSELAGKLAENQRQTKRLRLAIFQVEAVMKMLSPDVNLRLIAPKRRNTGNPWFKRGKLYRSALDVLRVATARMTARQIADQLLAGKTPAPTRKQEVNIQAAILSALRNHADKGVERVGESFLQSGN